MLEQMSSTMLKCIYCNQEKAETEFSLEHIFPQALGGELLDNLFKTKKVCIRCNSIMGLFVDGAYLKSYTVKSRSATDCMRYIDLENGLPCPLVYMGKLEGMELPENHICEFWMTPCTGRVLHLHSNLDEKFYAYAGGDPIRSKSNPGTAIFLNAAKSPKWLRIGLRSFFKHFKDAERVIAYVNFEDESHYDVIGRRPNQSDEKLISNFIEVYGESNQVVNVSTSIDLGYSQRFLAKIALGVGHSLCGEDFIESKYAISMREFLREKDGKKREKLGILLDNVWNKNDRFITEMFRWEGGIVISIIPASELLVLQMNIFGINHSIVMSNLKTVTAKAIEKIGQGVVYILVPQLNECIGPIKQHEYYLHKSGVRLIQELVILEGKRIPPNEFDRIR